MAIPTPRRPGYAALLRGRCSISGTTYFLTCCLKRPGNGLTHPSLGPQIQARIREVEKWGYWNARSSVLMPDHLHIVITLGADGRLAECIRCLKGPLTPLLRAHGLQWQEGFYDHRLRSEGELLPTFLYIFLNPYRAKLIDPTQKWPWYECAPDDWNWFGGLTNEATPFPEWLR